MRSTSVERSINGIPLTNNFRRSERHRQKISKQKMNRKIFSRNTCKRFNDIVHFNGNKNKFKNGHR